MQSSSRSSPGMIEAVGPVGMRSSSSPTSSCTPFPLRAAWPFIEAWEVPATSGGGRSASSPSPSMLFAASRASSSLSFASRSSSSFARDLSLLALLLLPLPVAWELYTRRGPLQHRISQHSLWRTSRQLQCTERTPLAAE